MKLTATPAIVDLNPNAAGAEIIIPTRGGSSDPLLDAKKLHSISTLESTNGIPNHLFASSQYNTFYNAPVIADLDDNGSYGVIIHEENGGSEERLRYFDLNNPLQNWTSNSNIGKGQGMPIAADLDNDGNKEIIIGTKTTTEAQGGIYIFAHDGDPFYNNDPLVYTNQTSGTDHLFDCAPLAVDLDSDGTLEIVFMSAYNDKISTIGRVFAMHVVNGEPVFLDDWGYEDHIINLSQKGLEAWLPALAVADLNEDGLYEVITGDDGQLHIWKNTGEVFSANWPVSIDGYQGCYMSPLVADVDEDDDLEIIAPDHMRRIHAFNLDGSVVDHWPLQLEDPLYGTPCIGDVDEDGKNEIMAGAGNKMYMWDTEGDANRIAWGHTG
ncbi:MAG: VCBS repeat-containing protein [Bacteroidota bacterium]|nr:VCBS repeat-containing protein [Bacteroidota bacterium]